MPSYDLVIRNGTVVTAAEITRCDVGVKDGRIAALADRLDRGTEEVDAAGLLVLPGGVDSHCHIDQKSSTGILTCDDFYTGGVSAACGGTTTFIPFAAQHKGDSLVQTVEAYHERAADRAFIDYAFHMIVSDPRPEILEKELPDLIRGGYSSFKIYLTYDALKVSDREALEILSVAKAHGSLVMVHAESHECIAWLTASLLREGHTAPRFHSSARPMPVEREATHRAITLAEVVDTPILIVHVSGREAMDEISRAQRRGRPVFAETCPQYLFLTEEDLNRPGFEGAKVVCSPPPRDRKNQDSIWGGLRRGVFHVYSSDHSPYRYDDPAGKMAFGAEAPFHKIPNGVPGLEVRMPLLFSEGVGKGRIDLHSFVSLTATNAAKIYGLYPEKGSIHVGGDADLAVWDPEREVRISADMLHDNMDYTPYEGMRVKGWPILTVSRGETLWKDGKVLGRPGRGKFLDRSGTTRRVEI